MLDIKSRIEFDDKLNNEMVPKNYNKICPNELKVIGDTFKLLNFIDSGVNGEVYNTCAPIQTCETKLTVKKIPLKIKNEDMFTENGVDMTKIKKTNNVYINDILTEITVLNLCKSILKKGDICPNLPINYRIYICEKCDYNSDVLFNYTTIVNSEEFKDFDPILIDQLYESLIVHNKPNQLFSKNQYKYLMNDIKMLVMGTYRHMHKNEDLTKLHTAEFYFKMMYLLVNRALIDNFKTKRVDDDIIDKELPKYKDTIVLEKYYYSLFNSDKCVILINEFADNKSLKNWLQKHSLLPNELFNMFFQVFAGLYTLQKYFDITHHDLHMGNILVQSIPIDEKDPFLYYEIDGTNYKIPNIGFLFIIWDFGYALINNKIQAQQNVYYDTFTQHNTNYKQRSLRYCHDYFFFSNGVFRIIYNKLHKEESINIFFKNINTFFNNKIPLKYIFYKLFSFYIVNETNENSYKINDNNIPILPDELEYLRNTNTKYSDLTDKMKDFLQNQITQQGSGSDNESTDNDSEMSFDNEHTDNDSEMSSDNEHTDNDSEMSSDNESQNNDSEMSSDNTDTDMSSNHDIEMQLDDNNTKNHDIEMQLNDNEIVDITMKVKGEFTENVEYQLKYIDNEFIDIIYEKINNVYVPDFTRFLKKYLPNEKELDTQPIELLPTDFLSLLNIFKKHARESGIDICTYKSENTFHEFIHVNLDTWSVYIPPVIKELLNRNNFEQSLFIFPILVYKISNDKTSNQLKNYFNILIIDKANKKIECLKLFDNVKFYNMFTTIIYSTLQITHIINENYDIIEYDLDKDVSFYWVKVLYYTWIRMMNYKLSDIKPAFENDNNIYIFNRLLKYIKENREKSYYYKKPVYFTLEYINLLENFIDENDKIKINTIINKCIDDFILSISSIIILKHRKRTTYPSKQFIRIFNRLMSFKDFESFDYIIKNKMKNINQILYDRFIEYQNTPDNELFLNVPDNEFTQVELEHTSV